MKSILRAAIVMTAMLSAGVAYAQSQSGTPNGSYPSRPVKILLPIGFTLLALQGISELIKRIAFLAGMIDDPNNKEKGPTPEEELAAAIAAAKTKEAK